VVSKFCYFDIPLAGAKHASRLPKFTKFHQKNVFDYPDESLQCIKKIGRINRPIFDFVF